MHLRSFTARLLAALCTVVLHAQDNCPWQHAEHQPASITNGPAQNCGGIDYHIGGVAISSIRGNCPLFVIYTPPHQFAVAGSRRTQAVPLGTLPITQVVFQCQMDWFLFIPVGSACTFVQQTNVGTVPLMTTRACDDRGAA